MSSDQKPLERAAGAPKPAAAAILTAAIGVTFLFLYVNGVQAARRDAEARLLLQVAESIQSPSTNREAILATLARTKQDIRAGQLVRTSNRLGLRVDWSTVFSAVGRKGKSDQARAARIIADECGLEASSSLKREQMFLAMTKAPSPTARATPLPQAVRQSVD
jgi:hypothetical protein